MTGSPLVPRRGTRERDAVVAVSLFAALVCVPLVLVVQPLIARPALSSPDGVVVAVQATVLAYAAGRLAHLALTAEPRWMTLIFWGFSYVWMGVAGLAQVLADRNPLRTSIPDDIALVQSSILLGGMVAFDVCSRVAGRRHRPDAGAVPGGGRVVSLRRVYVLAAASIVTAAPLTAVLGGVSTFFVNRQSITDSLTASGLYADSTNAAGGLLLVVANTLAFVPLLCLSAAAFRDRSLLRNPRFLVCAALLLGVNALFNNPLSNARYWFLTVVLGIVFCWLGTRRKARTAGVAIAFVASALLLFSLLNVFRYDTFQPQDTLPDGLFTSLDYGAVTDVGLIVRYVDRHGTTDGQQILGSALFFVPRDLWPDKPRNTYEIIAHDINFPYSNLDSPLWAEGYVDFGVLGAVGYLALLGAVAGASESRYLARRLGRAGPVPLVVVMVPAVAAYLPIILRGSLLQAMSRIVVMVGLLVLVSRRPTSTTELTASAGTPSGSTAAAVA